MNTWNENISYFIQHAHLAAWSLDALLKSIVVLALAAGVCGVWRRSSAATRHLIWFLAVVSLPCLLLLSSLLPARSAPLWSVSTGFDSGNQISLALEVAPQAAVAPLPASPGALTTSAAPDAAGGARKFAAHFSAKWMALAFATWLAGVTLVLLATALGQFRLRQFSRTARPLPGAEWSRLLSEACATLQLRRPVVLLQSADDVMPMTWGWWRPVVLLPAESAQWPVERRRIVLLHELAHVKRRDCLTQFLAKIVCALYWVNPLVWLAARQMGAERERACDDLVLNAGCAASEYAGHLVEIAGSFRRLPQMAAIAMARPSGLESRITAIVDASRNRRLRSASAIIILALIGSLAICMGGTGINAAGGDAGKSDALRQQQIARLEAFSVEKEKQSETLAAAAGETISPEFQRYFDAATKGDWQTVTNMYESFKQHHPQYGHPHRHSNISLRTSYWGPVLEISLAYDLVIRCTPDYTQMAVDDIINSIPAGAIYFGGTDPGRGLPTAFTRSHVDADPFYTLTQNALADGTYLDYLHKMYGDQKGLLDQMTVACRQDAQLKTLNQDFSAAEQKLQTLETSTNDSQWNDAEQAVAALWDKRDERVKAILAEVQGRPGANPAGTKALYIPTTDDSQKAFQDYIADAKVRLAAGKLKPGEEFKSDPDGRVQVSGQVAVMLINGLLVKDIFDKNPGYDYFIEESFPLDWMYPNLEPHGLIMKLNRQPLASLSDDMVRQDREFWQPRVTRMIGGWLQDDTSVKDVTAFAEKVFVRHDLTGFSGDPDFVQNDYASRMFSKFRSSLGGLYAWRADNATDAAEKARMTAAADFAFRQALALCPYSPEAAQRYAAFLKRQHRDAEAALVTDLDAQFKTQAAGK